MPSNLDFAFITRIVQDQDFHSVEKSQVREDYLVAPEAREVFRFIRDTYHHPSTTGMVPSFDMIRVRFPGFYFTQAPDSVAVLAQEIKRQKLMQETVSLGHTLIQQGEMDPLAAVATLKLKTPEISSIVDASDDGSMSSAYLPLLQRYEMIQNSGGVVGLALPWQVLSEELQGFQPSCFYVFYGRPKSGKTWINACMAEFIYSSCRKRVLWATREMPVLQMQARFACLIAHVDYDRFRKGKLEPHQKERVFSILRELGEDEQSIGAMGLHQPYLHVTRDRSSAVGGTGGGVTWLQAKIRDLRPDILFVDGMYLMTDDRSGKRTMDWKSQYHISQDLKQMAQDFDIPVVGITQAHREADKSLGEDLTEIGFADALGQDADFVGRVTRFPRHDEATNRKWTEVLITAPGFREGVFEGMIINYSPATDFRYLRTITSLQEVRNEYGGEKKQDNKPAGATSVYRRQPLDAKPPPIVKQR